MKSLIVIMGVCGSGKSTIANGLSRSLNAPFLEGDDFHPTTNIEKMASGRPLTNEDRIAWIDAMTEAITHSNAPLLILSCSALNSFVREQLAEKCLRPIQWVYLQVSREELTRRMRARQDHFMKETMIDSQLAALDPPENAHTINGDQSSRVILQDVINSLNDKT